AVGVGDGVGEAVAALGTGIGGVGEGAVIVVDHAALAGSAGHGDAGGQVDAVGAGGVVGEHVDVDAAVLGDLAHGVTAGHRAVVVDVDGQRGRVGDVPVTVGDPHIEQVLYLVGTQNGVGGV